jgi:hypothetical protein
MSLIPPNPFVMSKLYFLIEKKVKNTPLREKIHGLLGPYHEFRISCVYRNPMSNDEKEMEGVELHDTEIIHSINQGEEFAKTNCWNCIDTALNMYTRSRIYLTQSYSDRGKSGTLRFCIQYRERESKGKWSDSYVDEQTINPYRGETVREEGSEEVKEEVKQDINQESKEVSQ